MADIIKLEIFQQKQYSFGAFHSGIPLIHSVIIKNETDRHLTNLHLQIRTDSDIFSSFDTSLSLLTPGGMKTVFCSEFTPDFEKLSDLSGSQRITLRITVLSEEGEILSELDSSCTILPYCFAYNISQKAECLAFLITPQQTMEGFPSLSFVRESAQERFEAIFEVIKQRRITYLSDSSWYGEERALRLCERVWKEGYANSIEIALLVASALERYGIYPVLAFHKGKAYCGIESGDVDGCVLEKISGSKIESKSILFVDCVDFAFGAEKSLNDAFQSAKINLSLSDDSVLIFRLSKARALGFLPLPNRIWNGSRFLLDTNGVFTNITLLPEDFYFYTKQYGDHPIVSSVLSRKKFSSSQSPTETKFISALDVNQNRIFNKILSSDFTLIKAQNGSGAGTLFSHVAAQEMKKKKKVLYLTEPSYHKSGFRSAISQLVDGDFLFDLTEETRRIDPKELSLHFHDCTDTLDLLNQLKETDTRLNSYYRDLEGSKSIVSSFVSASDQYQQLRDANDTIIFSAEQVGALSDEMVQKWFSIVNDCDKIFSEIQEIKKNPLRIIQKREFSYEYKSSLIRELEVLLHILEELITTRNVISTHFPSLGRIGTLNSLHTFNELVLLFSEFKKIPLAFFEDFTSIEKSFRTATSLIQAKNENKVIEHILKVSFQDEIFSINASELYSKYVSLQNDKGLRAISQKYSILRSVKRFLLPNCDVENMEYILSRLDVFEKNRNFIQSKTADVFRTFSIEEEENEDSWKELQSSKDLCYQCSYIFQSHFSGERIFEFVSEFYKAAQNQDTMSLLAQCKTLEDQLRSSLKTIDELIHNQVEHYFNFDEEDHLSAYYRELSTVLSAVDNIKSWCSWLSVRDSALNAGMKNMILALDNGTVRQGELKRSFLRAFFKAVCEFNYIAHPDLIPEQFDVQEAQRKYLELKNQIYESEKLLLDCILSESRSRSQTNYGNIIDSNTALKENPEFFLDLYPCIISDPKTAKSIFENSKFKFDLILIEHRAILPWEDFVWVFGASRKVAFAGMPHSSFGKDQETSLKKRSAFDLIYPLCEDRHSLSTCYGTTPQLSVLKSAIIGGNRNSSRVYAPPVISAAPLLKWIYVAGNYDADFPKINLAEANATLKQVHRLVLKNDEKKISVVCANEEQKETLKLLFQETIVNGTKNQTLLDFVTVLSVKDPVETADIVVFSSVYSPDRARHNGVLPFEFLQFGVDDPCGCLNRIISSAKDRFILITSFQSQDLKGFSYLYPSVFSFSLLMKYAEAEEFNGSYESIEATPHSNAIALLSKKLEASGYQTFYGLRSGRFYFDLAVSDSDGKFQLGILSDQTILAQQAQIHAIEAANQELYEANGWKIYRLRSPQCFDSIENEYDLILSVLKRTDERKEFVSI